ncbi:MAG TPA: hypothetical protein VIJ72_04290 [Rhizomicrobium sp.]
MAQDVRRTHGAIHIDQKLWIGALEFDKTRRDPKSSKTFRNSKANFTGSALIRLVPGAHQIESGLFHRARSDKNSFAFRCWAHAIDIANQQRHSQRTFEIADSAAQGINRLPEMFRGCAKTSAPDNFQKEARTFPIGQILGQRHDSVFAGRNGLFINWIHTHFLTSVRTLYRQLR